jgi:hypothetical protein
MLNAAGQAVIESATMARLVTIIKNGPPGNGRLGRAEG